MRVAEYEALVAKHERRVDRRGYRWRVRLWMWFGSFVLLGALLLLVAFAGGLIAIIVFGKAWLLVGASIKYIAVAGFALVGLTKSMWMKHALPAGETLGESEHIELFQTLHAIAARQGSTCPAEVVLTQDLNAAVMSQSKFGPLPIYRHTLVLGMQLLEALSPEELDAVIGHELGHLSRDHGVFVARVYRARLRWLYLASTLQAQGMGEQAQASAVLSRGGRAARGRSRGSTRDRRLADPRPRLLGPR